MKFSDMIKICLQNLRRRKSRTFLTVLGVIVGCCAIVTMLSIGIGMQNSMELALAEMGDLTLIQVYGRGQNAKLDDDAIKKFEAIPGVEVAIGKAQLDNIGYTMYAGEKDRYRMSWAQIVGFSKGSMEKFGLELVEGTFPKEPFEVLAGEFAAYNLMDTQRPDGSNTIDRWEFMYSYDPDLGYYTYNENAELPDPYISLCGQKMKMQMYSYDDYDKKIEQEIKITGVVKEDYNKDYATSEGLIFFVSDLQALQKMVFPTNNNNNKLTYNEIYVKTTDITKVEAVEEEIKQFGYSTSSMESIRKPMQGGAAAAADVRRTGRGIAVRSGARHYQHDDNVDFGAHARDRRYEGARLLPRQYPRYLPYGSGLYRTYRRHRGGGHKLRHFTGDKSGVAKARPQYGRGLRAMGADRAFRYAARKLARVDRTAVAGGLRNIVLDNRRARLGVLPRQQGGSHLRA